MKTNMATYRTQNVADSKISDDVFIHALRFFDGFPVIVLSVCNRQLFLVLKCLDFRYRAWGIYWYYQKSSRAEVLMQVANTSSNYINNVKLRIVKTFVYSHIYACYACTSSVKTRPRILKSISVRRFSLWVALLRYLIERGNAHVVNQWLVPLCGSVLRIT